MYNTPTMPLLPPVPARFPVRLAAYYGAVFVIYGTQLPYLPVWMAARGLTPFEIGVIGALPLFARIGLGPAVAFVADRSGAHRAMVVGAAWIGLGAAAVLPATHGFPAIAAAAFLLLAATMTALPIADAIAMAGVRAFGHDYGRMRLWGSVTFIAANVAGGFAIAAMGADAVTIALVAGAAATVLAAHALPGNTMGTPTPARRPTIAAAGRLLRNPQFAALLFAAGSIQAAHAVFYVFGVLHWQETGLSAGAIGVLWGISIAIEVALLAFSARAVAMAGAGGLLVLGGLAGLLRWTAMAFDPPLALLGPLQALHALTFAGTHIGTVHLAQALAPEGTEGTAQALLSAMTAGLAMGIATAAAGPLYAAFGSGAYMAMAALSAAGAATAVFLLRR